jgi:hypothetical protein
MTVEVEALTSTERMRQLTEAEPDLVALKFAASMGTEAALAVVARSGNGADA